jgi:hypothetical protein
VTRHHDSRFLFITDKFLCPRQHHISPKLEIQDRPDCAIG